MKRVLLAVLSGICVCNLNASSLDGTTNIVYTTTHHVFHDGEYARGAVFMENGFTVSRDAGVRLDLLSVPVRGGMDLRETGSIVLENNLVLDSGFSLSSSGTICGNGHAIILGGDLTIPQLSTLKITSSLIIEGNGHTLLLDNFAQLLTDSHSTLTLRNLILRNTNNTPNYPPIVASGTDSKIVFDNVKIALQDDFWFNRGVLFVHNDVLCTGKSQFVYHSDQPSYIAPQSTLYFDNGTTFFYYPKSTSQDLIVMQDETSNLYLDGSSLRSTPTGFHLTKGKMFLEDQVNLDGGTDIIDSLITFSSEGYGDSVHIVSWSPNGRFLAVGGYDPVSGKGGFNNTDEVRIYQLSTTTTDRLIPFLSVDYGERVCAISWDPNGEYLAIGGKSPTYGAGGFDNTDEIRIYRFYEQEQVLEPVTSQGFGTIVYYLEWHPTKDYLAIAGSGATATGGFNNTHNLRVYYFKKKTGKMSAFASYNSDSTQIRAAKWSPSGKYLAFGDCTIITDIFNISNSLLKILYLDELSVSFANRLSLFTSISLYISSASKDLFTLSFDWTKDGRFIAVSGVTGIFFYSLVKVLFRIFEFIETRTTPLSLFVDKEFNWNHPSIGFLKWNSDNSKLILNLYYTLFMVSAFDPLGLTSDERLDVFAAKRYTTQTSGYNINYDRLCADWHPSSDLLSIGGKYPEYFGNESSSDEIQLYNVIKEFRELVDVKRYGYLSSPRALGWSYDDNYVAMGGKNPDAVDGFSSSENLRVYRLDKVSGRLSPCCGKDAGGYLSEIKWSPNQMYLAIGTNLSVGSDFLKIYKFNGVELEEISSLSSFEVYFISWHPSGKYLAVCTPGDTPQLRVYEFDGSTLTLVASLGVRSYGASWSSDGKYLAIAQAYAGSGQVMVYSFDDFSSLNLVVTKTYGNAVYSVDWSKVDNYVAIGGHSPTNTPDGFTTNDDIRIYKFTGDDLVKVVGARAGSSSFTYMQWSPDGRNLLYVTPTAFYMYLFIDDSLKEVFGSIIYFPVARSDWSNFGDYLAATVTTQDIGGSTSYKLFIYKMNRLADIFNQREGIDLGKYLDVHVLGGSEVLVNGIVNYANQD